MRNPSSAFLTDSWSVASLSMSAKRLSYASADGDLRALPARLVVDECGGQACLATSLRPGKSVKLKKRGGDSKRRRSCRLMDRAVGRRGRVAAHLDLRMERETKNILVMAKGKGKT